MDREKPASPSLLIALACAVENAAIIAIVLGGGTAAWPRFASSIQSEVQGTSVPGQLSFIAELPLAYARI
jgi:hypothetical protein